LGNPGGSGINFHNQPLVVRFFNFTA
jgi:hypothetical protein